MKKPPELLASNRTPAQSSYARKDTIGGKRSEESETLTAFSWEKTDCAEALPDDAWEPVRVAGSKGTSPQATGTRSAGLDGRRRYRI